MISHGARLCVVGNGSCHSDDGLYCALVHSKAIPPLRYIIEKASQESARTSSRRTKGSILQDPTLHLVAYVSPDHSGPITVDMTAMSGPMRARWFNTTDAAYPDAGGGLPSLGAMAFVPPGD